MTLRRKLTAATILTAVLVLAASASAGASAAPGKNYASGTLKPGPSQPAPPAGPVTTVSTTVSVTPSAFETATATCPEGSSLVGGGYATEDPGSVPTGTTAVQYSRRDGASSWKALALRAGADPGTLTVDAYCRTGVPPLTQVSKTVFPAEYDVASGDPISPLPVVVDCPPGQQAVAGGIDSLGFSGSGPFLSSARTAGGTAWRMEIVPVPSGGVIRPRVVAYAYCAAGPVYEIESTAASSGDPAIFIEPLSATASGCPAVTVQSGAAKPKKSKSKKKKGKRGKRKGKKREILTTTVQTQLVSGGFTTSPQIGLGTFSIDTSLYGSLGTIRTPEGGWRAFGMHQGTVQGSVTSEGYCMA